MTQPDTTELRTLAEAATPGPWHVSAGIKQLEVVSNEDDLIYRRVRDQQAVPDAAFIAAANPTTILALLDELDAAETKVAAVEADTCGGCKGQGAHRRHCPRHPNYHPWRRLADRAESVGDSIGVPELAIRAWALAGAIRDAIPEHPYRALGETANQPTTDPDTRIAGRCCQYPKTSKCDRCGQ